MRRAFVRVLGLSVLLAPAGWSQDEAAPSLPNPASGAIPLALPDSSEANGSNDLPSLDATSPADANGGFGLPETKPDERPNLNSRTDSLNVFPAAPSSAAKENDPPAAVDDHEQPSPAEKFNQSISFTIPIRVQEERMVVAPDGSQQIGKTETIRYSTKSYPLDTDLRELEEEDEAKRMAVLAITAARHPLLLKRLRSAKEETVKQAALNALKENYTEHYAIETWWRKKKLAELEAKLEKLRSELQQRDSSQDKYVAAAMTIATMHANGIAIEPPVPAAHSGQLGQTAVGVISGPVPGQTFDSNAQPPTQYYRGNGSAQPLLRNSPSGTASPGRAEPPQFRNSTPQLAPPTGFQRAPTSSFDSRSPAAANY